MSDFEVLIRSFHQACLDVAQRRHLGPAQPATPVPASKKSTPSKESPEPAASAKTDANQQALQEQIDELRSQLATQSEAMGSLIQTLQALVGSQGPAETDKRIRVVTNE